MYQKYDVGQTCRYPVGVRVHGIGVSLHGYKFINRRYEQNWAGGCSKICWRRLASTKVDITG